jgi:uncharacterized protein
MSIGHDHPELDKTLPHERILELCRRYGVSELSVFGAYGEEDLGVDDEVLFLVMFQNDDFGPWGSKLDDLENDLSGVLHRKVHVASRRGIERSANPIRKAQILGSAKKIL